MRGASALGFPLLNLIPSFPRALNDVVSELSAHHITNRAHSQFFHSVFECRNHFPRTEPTQIPARTFTGAGGKFTGQGFKTRPLLHFLPQLLCQTPIFNKYMTCFPFHRFKMLRPEKLVKGRELEKLPCKPRSLGLDLLRGGLHV